MNNKLKDDMLKELPGKSANEVKALNILTKGFIALDKDAEK